jgi:hypothetical protein
MASIAVGPALICVCGTELINFAVPLCVWTMGRLKLNCAKLLTSTFN